MRLEIAKLEAERDAWERKYNEAFVDDNQQTHIDTLKADRDRLKKALENLVDVYIETRDGKPYAIREIKIGMGAFDKAYDAFELARKALE
jgi:hypothetical protein